MKVKEVLNSNPEGGSTKNDPGRGGPFVTIVIDAATVFAILLKVKQESDSETTDRTLKKLL